MRKLVLAFAVGLASTAGLAQSAPLSAIPPPPSAPAQSAIPNPQSAIAGAPVAELSAADAILLGVVEGVTEFLPVSSTGHLIIATHFLRLESEAPLTDAAGHPLWLKPPLAERKPSKLSMLKDRLRRMLGRAPKPDAPEGVPLTLKSASATYNVVIQFGAIAAVALLYWPQFVAMALGLLGRDPAGRRLLINVLIAFIPAAVIGLLAHDWIEERLFSVGAVIVAQIAGALLMLYAEAWRRRHALHAPAFAAGGAAGRELNALAPKSAAGIGALQVLSLWPGTSRSMTTIVGGYFTGLDPSRAAEFSFILGFVTLTAATVYKSYSGGAAMIQVFGWPHVLLGCVVAAVTAAGCVRFLVRWLTRHGLAIFAWYRIAIAAVLAIVFYL